MNANVAACVVLLFVVANAGCSRERGAADGELRSSEVAEPQSEPGRVELSAATQALAALETETLAAASARPERRGYGRVLDPAPLAALLAEFATARSALAAAEAELARVTDLHRQDNASARTLEAARVDADRERWAARSARDRIALAWSKALADRTDLPALLDQLTAQSRAIMRIEVPAAEPLPDLRSPARLLGLDDDTPSIEADFVDFAPSADAQLQGYGLLYLTKDNALRLSHGMAVTAFLPAGGEPIEGVRVPRPALVRYAGQPWVYVQASETAFVRTPLPDRYPLDDGWLVPSGLEAGTRVVTRGAQVLLSEELKSQVRLED
jgi:membrane fusion protein, multidrug efflux system